MAAALSPYSVPTLGYFAVKFGTTTTFWFLVTDRTAAFSLSSSTVKMSYIGPNSVCVYSDPSTTSTSFTITSYSPYPGTTYISNVSSVIGIYTNIFTGGVSLFMEQVNIASYVPLTINSIAAPVAISSIATSVTVDSILNPINVGSINTISNPVTVTGTVSTNQGYYTWSLAPPANYMIVVCGGSYTNTVRTRVSTSTPTTAVSLSTGRYTFYSFPGFDTPMTFTFTGGLAMTIQYIGNKFIHAGEAFSELSINVPAGVTMATTFSANTDFGPGPLDTIAAYIYFEAFLSSPANQNNIKSEFLQLAMRLSPSQEMDDLP
jgi:hypothetical protein